MSNTTSNKRKLPAGRFQLGELFITPMAKELLSQLEVSLMLSRHAQGDWGICCASDCQANESALKNEARIISCYKSKGGEKVWIITEADRSATTVLLPSDY
ncbi:MAG: type I restriction endonuclease subunit M [Aureliella sp.]